MPTRRADNNNDFRRRGIHLACIVFALSLLCALPVAALNAAYAEDDAAQTEDGAGDDEDALEEAKSLINALPDDPGLIDASYADAIGEALDAYNALSAEEQALLDSESGSDKQSFGRKLEADYWALVSLDAIDNATSLEAGEYGSFVVSSSSMGKSTSPRDRTWSVVGLKSENGVLTGVIRCDSRSALKTMKLGGQVYQATLIDDVPQFEVPLRVNGDPIYFTVDANDIADSIAYELTVTLDDTPATPDQILEAAAKAASASSYATDSSYTQSSRDAVSSAADNLARVSAKTGVLSVEIKAASEALDEAIGALEKAPNDEDGDGGSGSGNDGGSAAGDDGGEAGQSEQTGSGSGSSGTASSGSQSQTVTPSSSSSSNRAQSTGSNSSSGDTSSAGSGTASTGSSSDASDGATSSGSRLLSATELEISEEGDYQSGFQALNWMPAAILAFLLALGFFLRSALFLRGLAAPAKETA